MIEIVLPLYLAFATLFLGLTMAAMPARDRRLPPHERMGLYGVYGSVAAALACVCIALAPVIGRLLLAFSTLFLWISFMATALRVRSWHQPPTPGFVRNCSLVLGLAMTIMMVQFLSVQNRDYRVIYQLSVSLVLLGWMLYGLRQTRRLAPSLQLNLMGVGILAMMLLLVLWSSTLLSGNAGRMLHFSDLFSEESLTFSMRLFVVSALALMLISANGYGLERLVSLKSEASAQKAQTEHLNQQLNQLLNEKEEMLQALSFAARSQNLPTIMSSLSHEINQPLGAIRLNADFLMAEDASLVPLERTQLLQRLVAGSITATEVLRDFRRFLEANITQPSTVDLSLLLTDLVRGFQTELTRRGVQVLLHAHPPLSVRGDPVQLESALTCALLYMLNRDGALTRHMEISTLCIGRFVHLHLLDDGPPLTAKQFEQALDRMGQDMKHHFSQSLWLSRAIIEHHGGTMNVHENNGQSGIVLQLPTLEK
jgi:signal transduction histidine kinase